MKKFLIAAFVFGLLVFPPCAYAKSVKATLISPFREKVVVAVGSPEAQQYFAQGYVLFRPLMLGQVNEYLNVAYMFNNASTTRPFQMTATTSMAYIATSTASSSLPVIKIMTDNASAINLLIQIVASSTSSVLNWYSQYSQNGIDWYDENSYTATSNVLNTRGAGTLFNSLTPASVATTTISALLDVNPALYTKVIFYPTVANLSLWAKAIIRYSLQH